MPCRTNSRSFRSAPMASRIRHRRASSIPAFDMNTAVCKQVNALDVDAYFSHLAKLMKTNPPTAQDAPIIARMARIGLVPGQDFDPGKLGFLDWEAIMMVPKLAVLEMGLSLKREKTTNGWLYFTK